jgi:hypothetical protein
MRPCRQPRAQVSVLVPSCCWRVVAATTASTRASSTSRATARLVRATTLRVHPRPARPPDRGGPAGSRRFRSTSARRRGAGAVLSADGLLQGQRLAEIRVTIRPCQLGLAEHLAHTALDQYVTSALAPSASKLFVDYLRNGRATTWPPRPVLWSRPGSHSRFRLSERCQIEFARARKRLRITVAGTDYCIGATPSSTRSGARVASHHPRIGLRRPGERHCLDHRTYARQRAEGERVLRINPTRRRRDPRRYGSRQSVAVARSRSAQRRRPPR